MEKTIVPINLFPVNSSSMDDKWALQTFPHWKAFYAGIVSDIPTVEDTQKWREAATDISEELKAMGVSKAHDKICDMMNSYFTFDRQNTTFCSLYDVLDFLGKPSFYKNNMEQVRNMIHMFQYGIFRVGYNSWALQAANDWMKSRNIAYSDKEKFSRRKGKGFVYKLLVSRASNSIGDRLQSFTEKTFKEYILVRDKKTKKFQSEQYECIPQMFNHRFPGYICRRIEQIHTLSSLDITLDQTSKLVNLAESKIKVGISFERIYNVLKQELDKMEGGKHKL